MSKTGDNSGAYWLLIRLARAFEDEVGSLGRVCLPAGRYLYVGSARRGLRQRVARHHRLAAHKEGRLHWHVDRLLAFEDGRLEQALALPGARECEVSRELAARSGITVPIRGFGATDCRSGCPAHLYRWRGRHPGVPLITEN